MTATASIASWRARLAKQRSNTALPVRLSNNGSAVEQADDAIRGTTELVEASSSLDELRKGRRRLSEAAGGLRSLENSHPTVNKEAQVRAGVEMLLALGKDELRVRWTKM